MESAARGDRFQASMRGMRTSDYDREEADGEECAAGDSGGDVRGRIAPLGFFIGYDGQTALFGFFRV